MYTRKESRTMSREGTKKYEVLADAAFSFAREIYHMAIREGSFNKGLEDISTPGASMEDKVKAAAWTASSIGDLSEAKHITILASEYLVGYPIVQVTLDKIDAAVESQGTRLAKCCYDNNVALKDVFEYCRREFKFDTPEWKFAEQVLMDKTFELMEGK